MNFSKTPKKNSKWFLFILLILSIPQVYAQSDGLIKGELRDGDGPVPFASIGLYQQDSLIQGTISDENGRFLLVDIPYGNYRMEMTYLGYKDIVHEVSLSDAQRRLKIPAMLMEPTEQDLGEVVIRGEKSTYSFRPDRKVFHVGKDIASQGASALEVLEQVPFVTVDPTGAVQLRGSSAVQILINGRRSGLTRDNAFDQIPSENIDRIEVITNPSASFEASGSAGIINIILKRDKGKGLNGQVVTRIGTPADYVIRPSINYSGKKINLFSTFSWRYSDYNGTYTTDQLRSIGGNTQQLKQREDEDRHDDGRAAYGGLDYFIDNNNSVTLAYFRVETKDTDETNLNYSFSDEMGGTSIVDRKGNSEENRNYNQLEGNYTRKFAKKGQKLTVDLQYDFWNSEKDWSLLSSGDLDIANVGERLRTTNESGSRDIAVKGDFVLPLQSSNKIEIGSKWEKRRVTNDYLAETFENDIWSTYLDIDNDVKYKEEIVAGYAQYQHKIGKVEYQVGLRTEHTTLDVTDLRREFANDRSFLDVFPSASVAYAVSQKVQAQVAYSRRIQRPNLWRLYPFYEISDFNLQYQGNPNLQSEYADAIELSILSRGEKLMLQPAIYYRLVDQPMTDFLSTDENNVFVLTPINIDKAQRIGAELAVRYQLAKPVRMTAEINVQHFDEEGQVGDVNLDADGTKWFMRIGTQVRLPWELRFQSRFDYHGAEQRAQLKEKARTSLQMNISKSFLDNQLRISIGARNITDDDRRVTIGKGVNYEIESSRQRYGPRYNVSATYRFNQTDRSRNREAKRGNR